MCEQCFRSIIPVRARSRSERHAKRRKSLEQVVCADVSSEPALGECFLQLKHVLAQLNLKLREYAFQNQKYLPLLKRSFARRTRIHPQERLEQGLEEFVHHLHFIRGVF